MVRKSGKFKKKEDNGRPKKKNSIRFDSDNEDMMDDDIDVFHKKRDVVPLNIHEDVEESDEDAEQPVLDFEDDDEEDAHTDEDKPPKGLAAKKHKNFCGLNLAMLRMEFLLMLMKKNQEGIFGVKKVTCMVLMLAMSHNQVMMKMLLKRRMQF
ncbi:nucleolin-like [Salvia splendens]|uniref:nucleolin-like n=1 Tax=Salvia splendens TaxID=180675 RepID=UPI001C258E62|nr:nucleolin-like [Salvia splendens]XP_042007529.1 nucleolin-like [Salvia splendens]